MCKRHGPAFFDATAYFYSSHLLSAVAEQTGKQYVHSMVEPVVVITFFKQKCFDIFFTGMCLFFHKKIVCVLSCFTSLNADLQSTAAIILHCTVIE